MISMINVMLSWVEHEKFYKFLAWTFFQSRIRRGNLLIHVQTLLLKLC